MKKRRSLKKTSFLSPKNKWVKRGKNLAYFTVSFILYSFAYIFWWAAFSIKWLFLFLKRKRPPAKEVNLAYATDKKIKIFNTQADVRALDRFARLEVLMAQLENRSIQEGLNIGSIIDLTEGCSETDLVKIVDIATQKAFSRKKGKDISPIVEDDLIGALESVKPSVN